MKPFILNGALHIARTGVHATRFLDVVARTNPHTITVVCSYFQPTDQKIYLIRMYDVSEVEMHKGLQYIKDGKPYK